MEGAEAIGSSSYDLLSFDGFSPNFKSSICKIDLNDIMLHINSIRAYKNPCIHACADEGEKINPDVKETKNQLA